MTIAAVYLDLTDVGSARLWRWLRAAGHADTVEVRPFCLAVPDPWRCTAPPLSLELLMLVEQARAHGPQTVAAVVDAAVDLLTADAETAAGQLEVRRLAGLGLGEYDETMDRCAPRSGCGRPRRSASSASPVYRRCCCPTAPSSRSGWTTRSSVRTRPTTCCADCATSQVIARLHGHHVQSQHTAR